MIIGTNNKKITQNNLIIQINEYDHKNIILTVYSSSDKYSINKKSKFEINCFLNEEILKIKINENIEDYNYFYEIESYLLYDIITYLLKNKYINSNTNINYEYQLNVDEQLFQKIKKYYENLGFNINYKNNIILTSNVNNVLDKIKENINMKSIDYTKYFKTNIEIIFKKGIYLNIPFPSNYPNTEFRKKNVYIAYIDAVIDIINKNLYIDSFYVNSNKTNNIYEEEKKLCKGLGKKMLCYLISYILEKKYLTENDNVRLLVVNPHFCDEKKLEKYKNMSEEEVNNFFIKFPNAINKYIETFIENKNNYNITFEDKIKIICRYVEGQKNLIKYYEKYGFVIDTENYKNSFEIPMISKIKYINDFCNIDNLCSSYDLTYLNNISENNKLFMKQIINNSNIYNIVKNKQLTYLIKNYFNPQPYEKIDYVYHLESLTKLSNSQKINIYCFADINSKDCGNYKPSKDAAYFLDQQIKTSTKYLDIYVQEEMYTKKTEKQLELLEQLEDFNIIDNSRENFIRDYLGCLTADKKKCKYPHIRLHTTDIRKSFNHPLLELLYIFYDMNLTFTTAITLDLDIDTDISLEKNIKEIKKILEKNKNIFSNQNDLDYNIYDFVGNNEKINKQIENIQDKKKLEYIIKYANTNWLYNITEEYFNNIKYDNIMKWINNYESSNYKTISEDDKFYKDFTIILDAFDKISYYFMDLYLMLRLYRDYTTSEYKYSDKARNIIIYANEFNIKRYIDLLQDLLFDIDYQAQQTSEFGCLNVSDLKQPLFV